jgi:hypothetical protein
MNEEQNGKKKPTTDQRRAMAKLTEDIFAKRIEQANEEERDLVEEISGDLYKELGIDAIETQIDQLEKRKESLGWRYRSFDDDTRGGRMLKRRLGKRKSPVRNLEKHCKQALADIWTCDSVDELNERVNNL